MGGCCRAPASTLSQNTSLATTSKNLETQLKLDIRSQPDDTTCGPTCLHAVYRYYGDDIGLSQIIREVPSLEEGGTLGVLLGIHALGRGYMVRLTTYNLHLFDPTWFAEPTDLVEKLRQQMRHKSDPKFRLASEAYISFLNLGGIVGFQDLSPSLIRKYLKKSVPVLTGLSSTYLYQHAREFGPECDHDDIRGVPTGHFVVLSGYDREQQQVLVSDPLAENPYSRDQKYLVRIERLICAILLGIVTYDANLLIIEPHP